MRGSSSSITAEAPESRAPAGTDEGNDECSGDQSGRVTMSVVSVLYRLSWSDATRQRRDRPRCGAGRCGWPDAFLGGGCGGGLDGYGCGYGYEDSESEDEATTTRHDADGVAPPAAHSLMGPCAVRGAARGPRDEVLRAPLWRPSITHTVKSVTVGAAALT